MVILMLPLNLLCLQVQQVDQVEEVQHLHHHQELDLEEQETHRQLVPHKEMLVVEGITKPVFILQVEAVVEQLLLDLQVEILEVQHPQEMVELVQQILLQDRQLVEQVEEMVKVVVVQHLVQVKMEGVHKIQLVQLILVEVVVVVPVEMAVLV